MPIPITADDQKQRGYNQTELITQFMNRSFGLTINTVLEKIKTNKKQSMLNTARARQDNVLGVYQIKPGINIKNQDFIVLDDVITTGATISEAGKVLKKAGAGKLIAWSLFGVR